MIFIYNKKNVCWQGGPGGGSRVWVRRDVGSSGRDAGRFARHVEGKSARLPGEGTASSP